jgi:hypothetical protein
MKKWKTLLLNLLGLVTTVGTIAVIYFVLYLQGSIKHLGQDTVIEFTVMIILSSSTKFFWYMSTESSIRNSEKYIKRKDLAIDAINEIVKDQQDFDKFIDIQNLVNYNTYVSNRCKGLTPNNYKLTFRHKLINLFRRLAHLRPRTRREFLNAYVLRVERKASKIHKLSASNIVNLSDDEDGLIDDRNKAAKAKTKYLVMGTLFSIVSMFATAMIGFAPNPNVDMKAATVKMVMYSANILMAILQTIFKAYLSVSTNDTVYFRKIVNILEKYEAYKENPVTINKVSYYVEEVQNAISNEPVIEKSKEPDNNVGRNNPINDTESIRHDKDSAG